MLKRSLLTVAVIAGFAAIAVIPVASATAASKTSASKCPPGGGSPDYCEKECKVPEVVGDGFLAARVKILFADCKVGKVTVVKTMKSAPFESKFFPFFVVVAQTPSPGTVLPPKSKVALTVKFNG